MSKKAADLETVPEPNIQFIDLKDDKCRDLAITAAKLAYLAKKKGDIKHWKDMAEMIKKEVEAVSGATWHCIVGSHFGSFVTHEQGKLIAFQIGHIKVLLFKHG